MPKASIVSIIWILYAGGALMAQCGDLVKEAPSSYVPKEISGWKAVEDRNYDPETIFNYIDGAGEVYRSYNFKGLFARRFEAAGRPALVVDLFDMGSGNDAFGMFTHDLEGERADIGQGAVYKGGLLSFWKSRFFVSVYAEEETGDSRRAIFDAGRRIAEAIPGEAAGPALVSLAPRADLEEGHVRYFHTHFVLNYHFFVSTENILRLDARTEAVLAPYGGRGGRSYLLIVRYPDGSLAREAWESFISAYMPDSREPGIVKTEDRKWTAVRRWNEIVAVVFGAPDRAEAGGRLDAVGAGIGSLDG
ncbi:MAG: hypothetical protein PHX45_01350 [Acidobacteriota bacterium]|nr:hypothetical protein [Acidobacteriota bacterium]